MPSVCKPCPPLYRQPRPQCHATSTPPGHLVLSCGRSDRNDSLAQASARRKGNWLKGWLDISGMKHLFQNGHRADTDSLTRSA